MNRRELLARLAAAPWLAALPAGAQPKIDLRADRYRKVGLLRETAPPDSALDALRRGLADLGHSSTGNVILEFRWADGRRERLGALATDLAVRQKVDLIVADGAAAVLAATTAAKTTPIVMLDVDDPVAAGIVSSITRPSGPVTGIATFGSELSRRRLALLREIDPNVRRFAVLANPDNAAHEGIAREAAQSAREMGATLHVASARSAAELEAAILSMLNEACGAVIVLPDTMLFNARAKIVHLAAQHHLPALYDRKEAVIDGGLVSYGASQLEMYRRAAAFVDRLLNGAIPSEIPIEQPAKYELVVNRSAARAVGYTLPDALLQRADQVVQ